MSHGSLIDVHRHPVPEQYRRAMDRAAILGSGAPTFDDCEITEGCDRIAATQGCPT